MIDREELEQRIVEQLDRIQDPEIPTSIYSLGLIYGIDIDELGRVVISMTLTSPGCPVAVELPAEVEMRVAALPGVSDVRVELVWEPEWDIGMMSEAARLTLGLF